MAKKGFTLIELVTVVSIIGLLAALIVQSIGTARIKAQNAQIRAGVDTVGSAIERYRISNDQFLLTWAGKDCCFGSVLDYCGKHRYCDYYNNGGGAGSGNPGSAFNFAPDEHFSDMFVPTSTCRSNAMLGTYGEYLPQKSVPGILPSKEFYTYVYATKTTSNNSRVSCHPVTMNGEYTLYANLHPADTSSTDTFVWIKNGVYGHGSGQDVPAPN